MEWAEAARQRQATRARAIGPGDAAEQKRQRVLDDGDLPLEVGNRRRGLRPVRLDAIDLEPVRHAAVQPVLEDT